MSRTSKMTFGNILLGLLLLSTIVVIGLIVLVYFQLTDTRRGSVNLSPPEPAASRQVEIMSPDGGTVSTQLNGGNGQNGSAATRADTENAQRQKEAEAAANALKVQDDPINTRALTAGAPVQKRPPRPRPPRPKEEGRQGNSAQSGSSGQGSRSGSSNVRGEVPLEPVNRPPRENRERPLIPKNSERRDSHKTESGERTLTPTRPQRQNKQSEAIDALF